MKPESRQSIFADTAKFFSGRLAEHGESPRGVDWNGPESQFLRFEQLSKVINSDHSFTVNDLGCGYGALCDFLDEQHNDYEYCGQDVSEDMIRAAIRRHREKPHARFIVAGEPRQISDYGIASGIFNLRMGRCDAEWQSYIEATLESMNRTSRKGFSFNCLTSYSDKEKMRPDLYYADPSKIFDLCKRRYSRNVAVLHDYGLYEFTVIVRKNV